MPDSAFRLAAPGGLLLALIALVTACGDSDSGSETAAPTNDGATAGPTGEPAEEPEGYILFRDGLGDVVALDLQTDETYAYDFDINSEAILAAECTTDGSQIAVLRQPFDQTGRELLIAGAEGEREYPLPPGAQGIAWAPDGQQIAYVEYEPQEGYSLHTLDLDTGEAAFQVRGIGVASSPRWSPDGTRIAFHAPMALVHHVWMYELGSGAERPDQLTDGDGEFDPEWTPDGDRLIVSAVADDDSFQIFGVDPDSGEMSALTDSDIFKRLPRYSPEGDAIAYTGSIIAPGVSRSIDALHSFGVFLMDEHGSNERPLTSDPRDNPGAGVDPFLDALLIGWCAEGPWLDESWTLRETTPTPAIR